MSIGCVYGDPTCPCQDGDLCHYVDGSDSPAMQRPVAYDVIDNLGDPHLRDRHGNIIEQSEIDLHRRIWETS